MKTHKLKVTLNEIKRMQQLAGILNEEKNPYDSFFDDDGDDTPKNMYDNKQLNDFVKNYVDLINDYIKKIEYVLGRIKLLKFGQNTKMKIEHSQLSFVEPVEKSGKATFVLIIIVKYSKFLNNKTFRIAISSDKDEPLMVALQSKGKSYYGTEDTEDIKSILSTNIKGLNNKLSSFRSKNFKVTRGLTGKILSDFDINTEIYNTKNGVPKLTFKGKIF
jgi:hypothetical protein